MLKKLLSSIIKAAAKIGGRKLDKFKNVYLTKLAMLFLNAGESVGLALLDEDKDNEAQLKSIIRSNTVVAISAGTELGREKVLTFKDLQLANTIVAYLNGVEEVLKALIDEDPNNEEQIKAIWHRRRSDLVGQSLDLATDKLSELIRKKITDPLLAGVIIEILQSVDEMVKTS